MESGVVFGVIRAVLTSLGGGLVAKGYIDADTLQQVIGAVAVIGGAAWSVISKKKPVA